MISFAILCWGASEVNVKFQSASFRLRTGGNTGEHSTIEDVVTTVMLDPDLESILAGFGVRLPSHSTELGVELTVDTNPRGYIRSWLPAYPAVLAGGTRLSPVL